MSGASRRTFVGACAATVAGAGGLFGYQALRPTTRPRHIPLYAATVAMGPALEGAPVDGEDRQVVQPGQLSLLVKDSRVVQSAPDAAALIGQENAVLADAPAWTRTGPHSEFARSALQDLHVLSAGLPSPVAAWTPHWRYTWPRDAAVVAVAQARTGQVDAALRTVRFLAQVQGADGWFQARYRPGTAEAPDARPRQLDGTGWALWAADRVLAQLSSERAAIEIQTLRSLIVRGTDGTLAALRSSSGLPPATPDFWEVSERSPTLATCALLSAGLESAVRLLTALGDETRAERARTALSRLDKTIASAYGRYGFPRHPGRSDPDIGVAFLLPPFRDAVNELALQSLVGNLPRLRRPAGGLAPGTTWHRDGISWTPATSTVASALVRSGQTARATDLLQWLGEHRTVGGSYPEKVLETGAAAAVAPLAWTAASVLLTIEKLPR
ncbi:hypothetical protein [Yimella sp. cx-51]|uniref:hypothetical protein n=1 Tax=Yimella sp. cx-51 TaxID=2770551 RepID=UPI00165DE086|nr:hypothetical protein [Yimella sp. cx-51]MBC9957930.1 hypothetical protein [Yimella sp. cx-51]QTH38064.1 hypothetical protein J5M86_14740 [Yimella sp. cx-51]